MKRLIGGLKSLFGKPRWDVFVGLISENGVVKSRFEDKYYLTFTLVAYGKNGGEIMEEHVVVRKEIPSMDYAIEGLEPLTVVKFKGEQVLYHDQNRIELKLIIKTNASHSKLAEVKTERQKPVTYESSRLGVFTLYRQVNWFERIVDWNGNEIKLCLSGELRTVEGLEETAVQLCEQQEMWDERLRAQISKELLDVKNDSWLEEDEFPLTEREFLACLTLESLTVYGKGEFEAWYNDGDAFWGHAVSVSANVDGTLGDCGIHG